MASVNRFLLTLSLVLVTGYANAKPDYGHGWAPRQPPERVAPELSVSGAGSALALLAGAALIATGRRRRADKSPSQ
jgi:hypothetical protein